MDYSWRLDVILSEDPYEDIEVGDEESFEIVQEVVDDEIPY